MGLFDFLFRRKKEENVISFEEETVVSPVTVEEDPAPAVEVETKPQPAVSEKKKPLTKKPTASTHKKPVEKQEQAPAVADEPTKKGYTGRFEIKKAKDGRYVFNLYAPNHVIVATSQIYSTAQSAVIGINSIISNAEKASVEDRTLKTVTECAFPKWEIYEDKGGQFRFRLYATNGSCVVHSQGYTTKSSCKKGIESIIRCSKNPEIDKAYLVKKDDKNT